MSHLKKLKSFKHIGRISGIIGEVDSPILDPCTLPILYSVQIGENQIFLMLFLKVLLIKHN